MNQFQISGYVAKVSTKEFKNSVLAEILLSIRHATKKNDETVYESALLPCQRWIRTDQKEAYDNMKGQLVTCTGFFSLRGVGAKSYVAMRPVIWRFISSGHGL